MHYINIVIENISHLFASLNKNGFKLRNTLSSKEYNTSSGPIEWCYRITSLGKFPATAITKSVAYVATTENNNIIKTLTFHTSVKKKNKLKEHFNRY